MPFYRLDQKSLPTRMETGQIFLHRNLVIHFRRFGRVWLVGFAALTQLSMSHWASAQSLEELIPDQAVENPQGWAGQVAPSDVELDEPAPAVVEIEGTTDPASDDAPADLPPIAAEEIEGVLSDNSPESLEFTDFGVAAPISTVDLETVQIARNLALAMPVEPSEFPEREQLVTRFSALSTLQELRDLEGNVAQVAVRVAEDEVLLGDLLRLYGYYDGTITPVINAQNGSSQNGAVSVRFDLMPGRQFRIGAVDLGQLAEAGSDFDLLRDTFAIWPGGPARTDLIVAERAELVSALGENGYPFASVDEPKLTVDHLRFEADLAMPVSPNGKYRFGEVVSSTPELLSSRHLATLARFDPGDLYQESEMQDLRQIILGTGLVSRIVITPREVVSPEGAVPGTVDVDVSMDPAPLRTIRAGVGYGTGEGFEVSGGWEHRNLFPPEGKLIVRSKLGTREMLGGVAFQRNNLGGRHRVLTLDTTASMEDRDAYNARAVTFLANYELKSTPLHRYRFTWGVGTELLATKEREIRTATTRSARQTYFVGAIPLNALLDTSDSLLDPKAGFRLGLNLSPELSWQGGDATRYIRARWDSSAYHRVGSSTVVAARVAMGSIIGASTEDIAPSRRFYAGGGGSIRGFGYEAVGIADGLGETVGGRSLAEFSLEARIPTKMFDGAISVVPFVDGGAVYPEKMPTFADFRFGAGLGFRYDTPIGPFRVDVATPINPRPQDGKIAVYVSLGQAF